MVFMWAFQSLAQQYHLPMVATKCYTTECMQFTEANLRINQESVLPLSQIAPMSAIATREGVFMKLLIYELVNAGSYLTASTVVAALKIV